MSCGGCGGGEKWLNDKLSSHLKTKPHHTFYNVDALTHAKHSEMTAKHASPFLGLWTAWILMNALPGVGARLGQTGGTSCQETAHFMRGCVVYYEGSYTINKGCQDCGQR